MRYRNMVTGAEFESPCEITAPDWECVDKVKKVIPEDKSSDNDTLSYTPEPAKKQAPPPKEDPVTKTKAPKKSPKRGARR